VAWPAAPPLPDSVTLSEQTIGWSTAKYATSADNGLVEGSLDTNTIVDRTLKTHVLENRYLKVTLLPEFGGRILSIIYKPTGHEELYRTEVGVPYGIKTGVFYYDWMMVYGGIFPTFPDPEHGRTWLKPWDFKVLKQDAGEVTVSMSLKDDVAYSAAPKQFLRGPTGIEATYYVTLKADRAALDKLHSEVKAEIDSAKASSQPAETAGKVSGKVTRQKARNGPAPSVAAASSSRASSRPKPAIKARTV